MEPTQALFTCGIHCLLVVLATPITPQCESVYLILIYPDLLRQFRLLGQHILDLPDLVHTQKTIFGPKSQTQRFRHRLKVAGDSHRARVAGIRSIHAADVFAALRLGSSVCFEDGIPPAPAEPYRADLVCAGDHAHGVNETVNDGLADGLTVFYEPRPQCGGYDGGVLGFVDQTLLFPVLEGWFDILEEGYRERIALVDVWEVDVETVFSVGIGQETGVLELPTEDYGRLLVREYT